jgi:glycosyltransferase involved in cell wall biosynthesis
MPEDSHQPKILIFVIAYYAESTLTAVLERIPRSIFDDFECEVLVVDDASEDRTFQLGREYRLAHPEIRMNVLRNELNQGYGGNQKVGYTYAIEEHFDFVVLLHGDGQYAPEEMPRLLQPLLDGRAHAVFGSRMLQSNAALRGGMPLYKFLGNRVLSRIQNILLGTGFSEFHSGYRLYSVSALARIPFTLNTNEFHFDTEIILQLLNAGMQIVELPIPTHYGDEISRVNGMKYAKDVIFATLLNVAHRCGIFYQRRFDPDLDADNTQYKLKLGFPSSHSYALDAVPAGATVLDLGSRPAGLAGELVKKGCRTTLVDQCAPKDTDPALSVVVQDLDEEPKFDPNRYEYLIMLDVIEHLRNPEQFLQRIRSRFDYTPKRLVLTTPNIAFIIPRIMLLLGQFNYGKAGILDLTHRRLFTFRSTKYLLTDAGFRIRKLRGIPVPFPLVFGNGIIGRTATLANVILIRVSKTLFSYQIYVEADSTPDVQYVVRNTRSHSASRA